MDVSRVGTCYVFRTKLLKTHFHSQTLLHINYARISIVTNISWTSRRGEGIKARATPNLL